MKSLKNAFINIRRSPYQSLLVVVMMSLTFIIGYTVSFVIYTTNIMLQEIESQPQVVAFFKLDTPKEKLQQVKDQIENLSYTKQVTLITQSQALKLYKEENQDEPLLLELVTADILPASIEVSTYKIEDLEKIKSELNKLDVIDDVVYQQDAIKTLAKAINTVKTAGLIAVAILALISFVTMVVIIALKVAGKKQSIKVMRLVGAHHNFIRQPYILEGALYGLIGSTIGFAISGGIIYLSWPNIVKTLNLSINPQLSLSLIISYFGIGTTIGVILGSFAGMLAVNRLIKR